MKRASCLLLPVLLLCASTAWGSIASPAQTRSPPAAVPAEHQLPSVAHIQTRALRPDQLAPLPSTRAHLFQDYDHPNAPQATHACDLGVFASSQGAALVSAVRAAGLADCLYGLFDTRGNAAAQTFSEAKMLSIAGALQADAQLYAGNNTLRTLQLVMFLRAGYYVEYADPTHVGPFGTALDTAMGHALDAFFANGHIADVNDGHGQTLSELVILVDSSDQNARQLTPLLAMLNRYGPSHQPHYYMRAAVNSVFSVLYNGHWNSDFQTLMQTQAGAVSDTLLNFVMNNRSADVGTAREYLLANAAGELGRLLQYPAQRAMLRPKVKSVLDLYGLTGPGASIRVRLAGIVIYYDNAMCAYYGLCSFAADLEAAVLPAANARDCSATVRVRSQALNSTQLDQVCAITGGQDAHFHALASTGGVPVPDDFNNRLEMVIFHSSTDYETYSGVIFGNYTNNGGVYLEGNPADPANQARFIAYEAEWLRPTFEVWNLTHEYVHYLDGRFNWHGGFSALPMNAPYSVIWYIEGFAEYVSYGYRQLPYASAISEAANPDRFTLSELFNTVYNGDYTRIYQWGYLATRYMFERQRPQIDALYAIARPGNYNPGYRNWVDPIRSTYNTDFRAWVHCLAQHNGNTSSCGGASLPDQLFDSGFED